jgi:small-conductance mechanosensitive channel
VASTGTIILDGILFIAVPAVAGYFVSRWAGNAAKRQGWSPVKVRLLRVVITILWVAIVIAGTAATLGSFSFLSALTISAVAGIAITLALQTTLQNILAGFILLRERFLHLGDVIQISGVKGTVVGIGLIEVVVRTENGALAMVSYSNLIAGPMINFTAAERLAGEY